jgi:hypothetical protein
MLWFLSFHRSAQSGIHVWRRLVIYPLIAFFSRLMICLFSPPGLVSFEPAIFLVALGRWKAAVSMSNLNVMTMSV